MHSYLKAIGFTNIDKQDLDLILEEAETNPDKISIVLDRDGNEFVELTSEVTRGIGIKLCGSYNADDEFVLDYYYPFFNADIPSTNAELDIIRQTDREAFEVVADDDRLGVKLIFFLQNAADYINASRYSTSGFSEGARLGALSNEGRILLPVQKSVEYVSVVKDTQLKRKKLQAKAKDGDETALEKIAVSDFNTYQMINQRINKEDIYSIVSSTFMPSGLESDKYSILAEIKDFYYTVNSVSNETLVVLELECNDLNFMVCIPECKLLGEPEIGRRFKGEIWLQGSVDFM